MKLYHYRNINSALKEINDETFHFSSKEELNDPLEGYIRVYWKSDKTAWECLFHNYICSLANAIDLYLLAADEKTLRHNSLLIDIHSFDNEKFREILDELSQEFLSYDNVKNMIRLLGNHELKVNEDELEFVLRFLHMNAMYLCIKKYTSEGYIPALEGNSILENLKRFSFGKNKSSIDFETFEKAYTGEKITDEVRNIITEIAESYSEEIIEANMIIFGSKNHNFLYGKREKNKSLDSEENIQNDSKTKLNTIKSSNDKSFINNTTDKEMRCKSEESKERQHRNWLTLMLDFPQVYVEQLKEMIYPEGYTVCFSANNDDSSMWGNYAEEQRGVCLIYDVDTENKDDSRAFCPNALSIKKVEYKEKLIERNFFETFGRLTISQIKSWLTGSDGSESKSMKVFKDVDKWRREYWQTFEAKWYRKLPAWKHEAEYRLVIDNMFGNFTDPKNRNLRYDLKHLKGVIFGLRTSEYDKSRIVSAVISKHNLSENFEFYQAYFDDTDMKLKVRKKMGWDIKQIRASIQSD